MVASRPLVWCYFLLCKGFAMSDSILELLETAKKSLDKLPEKLFILPLTETVVYPDVMMPIVVPPGPMLELVKRAQTHSDYLGFL